MKESEVAKVVKHLMQADKVLHEQQLGWDWQPPDDSVFTPALPAAAAAAHKAAAAPTGGGG